MYLPLSDDKHQMVRDSSKKCTGQCGCNSNPVATLLHAAVVFICNRLILFGIYFSCWRNYDAHYFYVKNVRLLPFLVL